MKKVRLFVVLLIVLSIYPLLYSQQYQSTVLDKDDSYTYRDLLYLDSIYVTRTLVTFPDTPSSTLLVKVGTDLRYKSTHRIDGIQLQRNAPVEVDSRIFGWGVDSRPGGRHALIELDTELNEVARYEYTSWYQDGGPLAMTTLGDDIVGLVFDNEGGPGSRSDIHVKRINQDGEELMAVNCFDGIRRTASTSIVGTSDKDLVFSGRRENLDSGNSSALVAKINKEGDIIWRYIDDDIHSSLFVSTYVAELTDGSIVYTNEVYRLGDWEFQSNGYNLRPWKLQWLSADGDSLMEYIHKENSLNTTEIRGIQAGKHGDYFFIYGHYSNRFDTVATAGDY